MNRDSLMCEDAEAAARSRANVARRQNGGDDCWYNRSTPDSRYEPLYLNTRQIPRMATKRMLLGRWSP